MKKLNLCEMCGSNNIVKINDSKYECYDCGYIFDETDFLEAKMATFDEWIEKYKPFKNEDGKIILFETYGGEVEYVKNQSENNTWTLQGDCDEYDLVPGFFHSNRIGYFITEIPYNQNDETEKELFCVIWVHEDELEDKI